MTEAISKQILLLAPKLLGDSLRIQLTSKEPSFKLLLRQEDLERKPSLVIWYVSNLEATSQLQIEARKLQDYWKPTPILLLLPSHTKLKTNQLLQFDCPGILQDPSLNSLEDAINTLIEGGRVVQLNEEVNTSEYSNSQIGLAAWLLSSGIDQINQELLDIDYELKEGSQSTINTLILNGRERELKAAKELLFWIWAPPHLSGVKNPSLKSLNYSIKSTNTKGTSQKINQTGIQIKLKERTPIAAFELIIERLTEITKSDLGNATNTIMAFDGLTEAKKSQLILALIKQIEAVLKKLLSLPKDGNQIIDYWLEIQPEIRQEAIRNAIGSYIRIPLRSEVKNVTEEILSRSNFSAIDEELPSPVNIIDPLIHNKPVLFEGQLLRPDDPRALLQLEIYISNWIIRTAEILSSELINISGEWAELRGYLLKEQYVSTRELERFRNQLNAQNRWQSIISRPIQLYESKRLLYKFSNNEISNHFVTEPRDEELRNLGWWQQQVALIVEARDAMAPQLQSLVKTIGDVMAIVLTQVLGRAIGLIGRGIAQGMGRSLSRKS